MKLNINAKELLALHDMLRDHFRGQEPETFYKADDPRGQDEAQLKQVYNRLRAIINAALTNPDKVIDPIDSWLRHETSKIDNLRAQNNEPVEIVVETKSNVGINGPTTDLSDIMRDDDDEVPVNLKYPSRRKAPPPPRMPIQQGKHKAHRR